MPRPSLRSLEETSSTGWQGHQVPGSAFRALPTLQGSLKPTAGHGWRGPAQLTRSGVSDFAEKLDEILAAAEPSLRPDLVEADSRAATVKQRPTSRRITPAEISVRGLGWGLHPGAKRRKVC